MAEPNPLAGLFSGTPPAPTDDENPLSGIISGKKAAPKPAPVAPPTTPAPSTVEVTEIDGMPVEEFYRKQAEKVAAQKEAGTPSYFTQPPPSVPFTPAKPPGELPIISRYEDVVGPRVGPQSFARSERSTEQWLKDLPENAPESLMESMKKQPLQPGGMVPSGYQPSFFTEYVTSPSAYVPQTQYESVISTPPYAELRASDIERSKILEAQGAGSLDPFKPRTVASDYGRQVEQFQAFKSSIGTNLEDIFTKSEGLTPEQRSEAARYYQMKFGDVPEVGAYYAAAAMGSIKREDIPTITKSLEGSIERMNPAKSVFDVTKGIPVVEQATEYVVKPIVGYQVGPSGELVEPAAITALRVLNSPVGLIAGGIEGVASGIEGLYEGDTNFFGTVGNTIGRYVREGRGFSDAASQIFGRIGAAIGGEESSAQQIMALKGLGFGLAIDLLTGPDEVVRKPVTAVAKVAGTVPKVIDVAINNPIVSQAARRSIGEAVSQEVADAANKAIKDFVPTPDVSKATVPQDAAIERFVADTGDASKYSVVASLEPTQLTTATDVGAVEARNEAKVAAYNKAYTDFTQKQAVIERDYQAALREWEKEQASAASRAASEVQTKNAAIIAENAKVQKAYGEKYAADLAEYEKGLTVSDLRAIEASGETVEDIFRKTYPPPPTPARLISPDLTTPGQRYAASMATAPRRPVFMPPERPILEVVPTVRTLTETPEQQVTRRLAKAIQASDNVSLEAATAKVPEVIRTLKAKGFLDNVAGGTDAERVLSFIGDLRTRTGIVGRLGTLFEEASHKDPTAIYDTLIRSQRLGKDLTINAIAGNVDEIAEPLAKALSRQVARQNYLLAITTGINRAKPGVAVFSNTTGILTSGLIRVTPDTYAPVKTAQAVVDELKTKPIFGTLTLSDLSPNMTISDQMARMINDGLQVRLYVGKPITAGKLSDLDYQNIFNWVLRSEVRKQPFWLSTRELSEASTKLGAASKELAGSVSRMAAGIRRGKLQQNIFTGGTGAGLSQTALKMKLVPGELRRSMLSTAITAAKENFISLERAATDNPITSGLVSDIKNAWGSIFDRFRVLQRQAKKSGLSDDEAFAKVILSGSDETQASNAFNEYVKLIYGSNNAYIETYRGRQAYKQVGESSPIASISKLVDAALDPKSEIMNEALVEAKDIYLQAIREGRYSDALDQLFKVHTALAGRTLHQGLFGWTDITSLAAKDNALVSQAQRSALKATERTAVKYAPQNFLDLVSASWTQTEQTKIVQEVMDKYTTLYPQLFTMSGRLTSDWFRNWSDEVLDLATNISGKQDIAYDVVRRTIDTLALPEYSALRNVLAAEEVRSVLARRMGDFSGKDIFRKVIMPLIKADGSNASIREAIETVNRLITGGKIKDEALLRLIPVIRDTKATTGPVADAITRLDQLFEPHSTFGRSFVDAVIGKEIDPQKLEDIAKTLEEAITKSKTLASPTVLDELDRLITFSPTKTGVKAELIDTAAIKELTEQLKQLVMPTEGRVLSEAELIGIEELLKQSMETAIDYSKKFKPGEVPLATGTWKSAVQTFRLLANIAKAGTLGGIHLPIFSYHMANILSAPFIAMQNLGPSGAKAAAKGMFTLPIIFKATRVVPNTTASKIIKAIFATGDNAPLLSEVITTPSGMKYTVSSLVDAVTKGSVMRSQAGAELSRSMLDDFVAWSGRHGIEKRNPVLNWLVTNWSPARANIWNQFSDAVDANFRLNVFADAIDNGKPIEEAIKLARESLFDYGSLSNFERNVVSKAIWFYTFWSRNLLKTMENIISNPGRLTAPYRAKVISEKGEELDYDPTYAQNSIFRKIMQDKETATRYSLTGTPIPQMQALTDLIDYSGLFASMAGLGSETSLTPGQAAQKGIATVIGKGRPLLKDFFSYASAAKTGQGFDFGRGKEMTPYLDPRYVWWLNNTGQWENFKAFIPVDELTIKDQNPAFGTYMGLQYRIKPGYESRYFAFTESLLPLGLQRTAREYADIVAPITDQGKLLPTDRPEARFRWPGWFEWAARSSGVLDATETPTMREALWIAEKARTPKSPK